MQMKARGYKPTPHQKAIHLSMARFRVIAAGRRWGKNYCIHNEMMKNAWQNPRSLSWWGSPVYRQAKRDFRRFKNWFKPAIQNKWETELRIELTNKAVIEFHGLEEPENLEGEGLDFLYVDEAGKVKDEAWYDTLMPMLVDKGGRATMFGKPKGKSNWFYKFFALGQTGDRDMYQSWQFKSTDSPYIDGAFIREIRKQIPSRVFKQEFEAQFLDDSVGIFSGYNECIQGQLEEPVEYRTYRMGVDLAKRQDWTVCTVIDLVENRVVGFKRFQDFDYGIQKRIISEYALHWNNAEIVIDSTGVGEPIYDDLKRMGLHIVPYRFSYQSKINLIENLIVKIQNREIAFPLINELVNELEIFTYTQTASGNVRYSAPPGYHDDCVISLALAIWGYPVLTTLKGLGYSKEELDSQFDNLI